MANDNRSTQLIPATVITEIFAKLKEIDTLLAPYVTPLTKEEREVLFKMGDKSLSFVTKAHDYSISNPEFLPNFIDQAEFDLDFANATSVNPVSKLSLQIHNSLNDTVMVAGSEAFQAARGYYDSAQLGDKQGIASARTICEELQKRFPGRKRKDTPNP